MVIVFISKYIMKKFFLNKGLNMDFKVYLIVVVIDCGIMYFGYVFFIFD